MLVVLRHHLSSHSTGYTHKNKSSLSRCPRWGSSADTPIMLLVYVVLVGVVLFGFS